MAGARIQAATSGLHTLVQTLKPRDVLALFKFNTSTDVLQKFDRNHKIAWRKHVALLNAAPSGATALYDAIVHSIDALQMHAKPQHDSHQLRVVVLLTDGDDTCSTQHTLDSVIQRVHS
jgi:Mg-chelatase subunit ChlD